MIRIGNIFQQGLKYLEGNLIGSFKIKSAFYPEIYSIYPEDIFIHVKNDLEIGIFIIKLFVNSKIGGNISITYEF